MRLFRGYHGLCAGSIASADAPDRSILHGRQTARTVHTGAAGQGVSLSSLHREGLAPIWWCVANLLGRPGPGGRPEPPGSPVRPARQHPARPSCRDPRDR